MNKENISAVPEMLDRFDAGMRHIGTATRDEVHKNGWWHQCFHCWLVMRDSNGCQYLLFQLRSTTKKDFPGLLDISSAGHLLQGETVEDGLREVYEEVGLSLSLEDLTPLGIRTSVQQRKDFYNCEFSHVFLGEAPYDGWDCFQLQKEELDGLFGIAIEDGLKLFCGRVQSVRAKGFRGVCMGETLEEVEVSLADFVPQPVDNYHLKMCIAADLYLRGYPYLADHVYEDGSNHS